MGFGNDKKRDIISIGKVDKSHSHAIENVYYVKRSKHKLWSVSQMCDKGNQVMFTTSAIIITNLNSRNLVLRGTRHKIFTKMILCLILKKN